MKTLNRLIAVSLVYALGVQPTFAQFQAARTTPITVQTVPVQSAALVGGLQVGRTLALPSSTLQNLQTALPTLSASPALSRPGSAASTVIAVPGTSANAAVLTSLAATSAQTAVVQAKTPASYLEKSVAPLAAETAKAVEGVERMGSDAAGSAATKQFSLLTGEQVRAGNAVADPVPSTGLSVEGTARAENGLRAASVSSSLGGKFRSLLGRSRGAEEAPAAAETPAPAEKTPFGQVFKDGERNKSFWRYLMGYAAFLFGYEMYIVGVPFLISAFTKNTLKENNDQRMANAEALKTLIRENRSFSRIAHWVAAAFSYPISPLVDRHDQPGKILVRSLLVRTVILAGIPALFFASGIMSTPVALATLFILIGLQSFVQGISVTMESASMAKLFGDKSVTAGERLKANSILTFTVSTIAIIAPAIAAQFAKIPDMFGKTGIGGAVIYSVYALATAVTAMVFSTIRIFNGKSGEASGDAAAAPAEKKAFSAKGLLLEVLASVKDGVKLILKNRFLATMMGMSLISSLFSDPLIFNILPEFVENVLSKSPAIGFLMDIPGLGLFLKSLMSTPMGYYSLLVVFSSIGSIVATALAEPLRKLFVKMGFKTEESLTIPFYLLAVLEAPLFWLMVSTTSPWAVLVLYGLQTLVTSFGTLVVSGLHQKTLGGLESKNVNKVLAAESFMGIIAAIVSTYLYGFVLNGISVSTSLYIAAIATTVLAAVRLAAPWLFFSKEQRRGGSTTEGTSPEAKS